MKILLPIIVFLFSVPAYSQFYDLQESASAVDSGGVASTDIDLNANKLICDADGDTWIDAATLDDRLDIYTGGSLQWTIDASSITGAGAASFEGQGFYSTGSVADVGAACTPAVISAGVCMPGDVEIQGNLSVAGTISGTNTPDNKSYAFLTGSSGTHYDAGFYSAPAADANLNEGSTTVTYGTANVGYAAHAFAVVGGAGAASGGSGAVVLTVSGVSITDAGVRTPTNS
jgi:cytoskeletal protein CcmA (bactofilin family)